MPRKQKKLFKKIGSYSAFYVKQIQQQIDLNRNTLGQLLLNHFYESSRTNP